MCLLLMCLIALLVGAALGAAIGGYRGGPPGALLGAMLGILGLFGWVAIAWLTREGTALNPRAPEAADSASLDDAGLRLWKLERELRGSRTALAVLVIWSVCAMPMIAVVIAEDTAHGPLQRSQRRLVLRNDEGVGGSIAPAGSGEESRLSTQDGSYWISLVLRGENASPVKLVLSSTEDGRARLDLLNEAGESVWHAP